MRTKTVLWVLLLASACGKPKQNSIELITIPEKQSSLFQDLVAITGKTIPDTLLSDSLAFLILPVQASCPACRKKTIDSIAKHQSDLNDNHYIIVSANGGRRAIRGYFQEQNHELPDIPGKFFMDSLNLAYQRNLYVNKPTIYFTYNRKVYKKVAAIPATVRDDLREFFSGYRDK